MAKNTDEKTPTTDKEDEPAQDYGQYEDDVIERPLRRSKTISLNRRNAPEPALARWAEELHPYEEPFPNHDGHGRALVATPEEIHNVPVGSPIIMRGTLWRSGVEPDLLHRSLQIEGTGESRLVLILDPIDDIEADEFNRHLY